jgi:hypothetical protein
MPLDSYSNLQNSIMDWLARPADPLIAPAIPDIILMFEEEARDRLRTRFNETVTTITPPPDTTVVPLPSDFVELRELYITTAFGNRHFTYQTPPNMDHNLWYSPGFPAAFTIEGLNLRMTGDSGDNPDPINIVYMSGLPGLSAAVPSNWLLQQYPSLYLFGCLTYAEPYIGDDPRFQIWGAAREAGFERIRLADRKAKYTGGPLVIQTDVRNP